MAFYEALTWHEGEQMMQQKLHVPDLDNPTIPMLSPQAANMLQRAPLLAIGTMDAEEWPWTTVWGGDKGFAQPVGGNMFGVRATVAAQHDPVIESLLGLTADGEIVQRGGNGPLVAGLALDLQTRKRVKLAGRMVGGALDAAAAGREQGEAAANNTTYGQALMQLVIHVDESLGNCPKYLNKKEITRAAPHPTLVSDSLPLPKEAVSLIHNSDLFFLSTARPGIDMDMNHRGGPPGFARVLKNSDESVALVYPEYSGNRFYQSLGNMVTNPKAGWTFPDFATGDCLFLTGSTEILIGKDAASVIARSNLAVKLTVSKARFVRAILPFRGTPGEPSPYNPTVRYLTTENKSNTLPQALNTAKLLRQTPLTPTISIFHFSLSNSATYSAGQYVTLDFSAHLDVGYSHMRDDDPRSLNDDFIRTFTVSSPPGTPPRPSRRLADDEFEITIRKVGVVTGLLFKQGLADGSVSDRGREDFEVVVKGFGGSFVVQQDETAPAVGYIAAGVGITPLMPSLGVLDLDNVRLLWSVREEDAGLVRVLFAEHPALKGCTTVFLTGLTKQDETLERTLERLGLDGARVERRRMTREDVDGVRKEIGRWYLCTGTGQRNAVLEWLEGEEVLYEDYNF